MSLSLVENSVMTLLCPPVIPFASQMAMELLEKGRVRFWTQVEKWTPACEVEYVFNDVIITQGKVGIIYFLIPCCFCWVFNSHMGQTLFTI